MRSHGRNKRSRRDQEPDPYTMQADDPHVDQYHRSHPPFHPQETYRPASNAGRASYGAERTVASHSRHDNDWRHPEVDHGRYGFEDIYARGERHDYDAFESRTKDTWRASEPATYPPEHSEWSAHYTASAPSAFPEPQWGLPQDSYSGYNDGWAPRDTRDLGHDDWGTETVRSDPRGGWRQQTGRKRDKNPVEFQSDSGWDSRRRDRYWDNSTTKRQEPQYDASYTEQERAWEPAPTWKSNAEPVGQHQQYAYSQQRQQNQHQHAQPRHKNGPQQQGQRKRNNQQNNRQRRDNRMDDNELNNWTRRDNSAGYSNGSTGNGHLSPQNNRGRPSNNSKRKHIPVQSQSQSRSRSRSTTRSSPSYRSERGRSRSRSSSPVSKRRRREDSPTAIRSRSPHDQLYPAHGHPNPHSPSSSHGKGRRSRSPGSSASSHRSPSCGSERSGQGRNRLASEVPAHFERPVSDHPLPTPTGNGKARQGNKKGRHAQQPFYSHEHSVRRDVPYSFPVLEPVPEPLSIQMPPPTSIPTHRARERPSPDLPSSNIVESTSDGWSQTKARPPPNKNAGFKPIGQPSPSLKKFFPGDDEDMDLSPVSTPQPIITSESPLHTSFLNSSEQTLVGYPANGQPTSPLYIPPVLHPSSAQGTALSEQHPETPSSSNPSKPPHRGSSKTFYEIVTQVGEGTFGKVYKAKDPTNGNLVALKRIRMESERDGFPVTAMREIKLLQSLSHKNVVFLHEMMIANGSFFMVFEYMDHDLTGILSQTQFLFTEAHLKSMCHQMITGLAYLHHRGVIHRDIKGSNILLNNAGELKLADFGLARFYQKRRRADYTNRVITLWYRPPELLFGATNYGPEVDMWSAGCIMLELFTKKAAFPGNDEISQLHKIFEILGTPTTEQWPDVVSLPWYELIRPAVSLPNQFRAAYESCMSVEALNLAERLLEYDPARRISARDAIESPYFTTELPVPEKPVGLAGLDGEYHELETKRDRAKRKERRA